MRNGHRTEITIENKNTVKDGSETLIQEHGPRKFIKHDWRHSYLRENATLEFEIEYSVKLKLKHVLTYACVVLPRFSPANICGLLLRHFILDNRPRTRGSVVVSLLWRETPANSA